MQTTTERLNQISQELTRLISELAQKRQRHITHQSWMRNADREAYESQILRSFIELAEELKTASERDPEPLCVVMPNLTTDLKNIKTFGDMLSFVQMFRLDLLPNFLADLALALLKIYRLKPSPLLAPSDTALQMLDEPTEDETEDDDQLPTPSC